MHDLSSDIHLEWTTGFDHQNSRLESFTDAWCLITVAGHAGCLAAHLDLPPIWAQDHAARYTCERADGQEDQIFMGPWVPLAV